MFGSKMKLEWDNKALSEAINAVFPQTDVQLCIVHMVRNSLKYVGYKDRKQVASI
jgi:transposase-like protein